MVDIRGPVRRSWLKVLLVTREVSALSPATMRAIARNSVTMIRADRADRAVESAPATSVSAGQVLGGAPVEADGAVVGATVAFERATLEVRVVAKDLVRLSWGPDDEPVAWATGDPIEDFVVGEVTVESSATSVEVTTDALRVLIDQSGVSVYGADDSLRYRELTPLRRGAGRVYRRRLRPGEAIAGFGEQAHGLDLRGKVIRFWNRDPGGAWGPGQNPLYCSIPVSIGRHADGSVLAFHENSYDATATIGAPSDLDEVDVEIRFIGGMLRTWVCIGDEPTLLERFTALTGRHPLPPRWALGYHQSRWGYSGTAELREVLDGFASRKIPLSVLHLDIDYMDKYRVFSVDPDRFGGLSALSEHAADGGARLVTIIDPAIRRDPNYDLYDEGDAQGYFVTEESGATHVGTVWPGWAVFPDFTNPEVRSWWAGHYPRVVDQGIAGIWHDMNEPTSITLAGDRTIPRSSRHDNDGRGGDHRESHNVYGLLMNRAGRQGLADARPDRRPFIVSRSGWASMQRDAWNWTADVESSPDGLRQQVATFIGLGLSGVAFTGSDIGGFSGIPSPRFFLRWLELGVVSPFCRTHSVLGAPAREPWRWPDAEAAQIARLISLRYRLLPYLYTLADETARTGAPMLRPLWWGEDATSSAHVEGVDDVAQVGDRLVFAVMTETDDATRTVALPAGTWWLWRSISALSGGTIDELVELHGGGEVEVEGRVGQPLLFVRAGSILPLDDGWREGSTPEGGLAFDHRPRELTFHVFADTTGAASGSHYDDEGDGFGPFRRDELTLRDGVVSWKSEGEMPRPEGVTIVVHDQVISSAVVDDIALVDDALRVVEGTSVLRVPSFEVVRLFSDP